MTLSATAFSNAVNAVLGGRTWKYGTWAPDADPPAADCSTFAAAVLQAIYGGRPGDELWAAINVYDNARPWSGPDYLEALGHMAGVTPDAEVFFAQRWDSFFHTGHAFFVVSRGGGWVRVEASKFDGVGFGSAVYPSPGAALLWDEKHRIVALMSPGVPMSSLSIPPEVRDEAEDAIEIASQVATAAVVDALADGRIDPHEAKIQIARVVESVIDGLAEVIDALLVLPEPVESVSDVAIRAAAGEARKAAGPAVAQIGDVVRNVLRRDADELETRAARIATRNPRRAEKLRKKAAALR
jgi:hypothetical protein